MTVRPKPFGAATIAHGASPPSMTTKSSLRWALGLGVAGATLVLLVGLAGAATLYGFASSDWFREAYRQMDPVAAAPDAQGLAVLSGIVLAWTLVVAAVAYVAAALVAAREGAHALAWGIVLLVAGAASLPITGGLGVGALMLGAAGLIGVLEGTVGQPAPRLPPA